MVGWHIKAQALGSEDARPNPSDELAGTTIAQLNPSAIPTISDV